MELEVDLDQATAALGALLDRMSTNTKARLDAADLATFHEALAAVGADARKAHLDVAGELANRTTGTVTRTDVQAALLLASERLADRHGLATKASAPLDRSASRLRMAMSWRDKAAQLVQAVPHAAHYRYDLEEANRALKAAYLELRSTVDEAEVVADDEWIERWIEHGRRRLARIKSEVYIGKLRAMGHFGS